MLYTLSILVLFDKYQHIKKYMFFSEKKKCLEKSFYFEINSTFISFFPVTKMEEDQTPQSTADRLKELGNDMFKSIQFSFVFKSFPFWTL